jgi:hypothetical protein
MIDAESFGLGFAVAFLLLAIGTGVAGSVSDARYRKRRRDADDTPEAYK